MREGPRFSITKDQLSEYFAIYFDRGSPLGSLRRIHAYSVSADTLTTVALAGTLFFSISPGAAKSQIALYLALTMAPFAIVSPILSPALDRGKIARRLVLLISAIVRIAAALAMANNVHSMLIFPLALAVLISSKLYLVAKAALVPELLGYGVDMSQTDSKPIGPSSILVKANSQLSMLGAGVGIVAGIFGATLLKIPHIGAPWILRIEVIPLILMLGELSVLAREARKLDRTITRRDPVVEDKLLQEEPGQNRPTKNQPTGDGYSTTLLASAAMAVLRSGVGFFTFLIAFSLKRANSSAYEYGLVLLASAAGAILATATTPKVRLIIREQQLLLAALVVETVCAIVAAYFANIASQVGLALIVGWVAASGKLSFDAIVQHHISQDQHGRIFAKYEMRFQVAWVAGALVPTLIDLPLRSGDAIVASSALVAALFFATSRAALRFRG
ncbi:MAG: hypothetical protein HKL83_08105 [Acidimicrobiaceae bacterium]|nr:hypothetical protein [Acidimicrobiaceae bacterium]